MTYLDWNEGYEIPDYIMRNIKKKLTDLHHYSDPSNIKLKEALEKHTKVDKAFIEVFNGSDSAQLFLIKLNIFQWMFRHQFKTIFFYDILLL